MEETAEEEKGMGDGICKVRLEGEKFGKRRSRNFRSVSNGGRREGLPASLVLVNKEGPKNSPLRTLLTQTHPM